MNLKTKGPITSGRYTERQKKWNWKFLLRLALTGVGFYFVSRKIDFNEIALWIVEVPIMVIAGAILLLDVSRIVGAYRLNFFFGLGRSCCPKLIVLSFTISGCFIVFFLPGGIGGDGYRIYYLNKFH